MAKTYLRTGRISWSPLTASQQTMLANVAGINVGSTFSATLDSPTETFLINNGVIAIPSSAVVASSGDTVGTVPVDNGDGTYSWGAGGGGGGVTTFNTRSGAITLSKADVTGTGLAAADVSADASGAAAAAQAAAIAASAQGLVPTAVKATNYTAAASDFVPVDASGGVVTVTLPSAPADKTRVGVKIIAQAGTPNTVTVARGGSDVFNKAGGSTSLTLSSLFQSVLLQYQSSTGIWYAQSTDYQLPASVVSVSSGTPSANQVPIFTGTGNAVTPGSVAGLPSNILAKTTTYTAVAGDFVEADATSAGFTVTLPTAPSVGALVAVKKIDSSVNTVTIAAGGGGTIDGSASTATSTQWAGLILEHKGSNVWRVAASMTTTGPAGPAGLGFGSVVSKVAGYTILSTDTGNVFAFNGSSLTATLPSTVPASPWMVTIINLNASSLTVSPNGKTLNGSASNLVLAQNQSAFIWSDGSNYEYGTGPQGAQGASGGVGGYYGDGTDGTVTFDGSTPVVGFSLAGSTYTATRNVYFAAATINNTVTVFMADFIFHCSGTLTVNTGGVLHNDGKTATTNGGASATNSGIVVDTKAGVNGTTGTGANGNAATFSLGAAGGAGGSGASGAGGSGGAAVGAAANADTSRTIYSASTGRLIGNNYGQGIGGGGSGGSGGGDGSNSGGGSGAGGGVLIVNAHAIVNNGAIHARGGGGATWGPGNTGGGGGGGGGAVLINTPAAITGSGTVDANGGIGPAGTGTGTTGSTGSPGTVRTTIWT